MMMEPHMRTLRKFAVAAVTVASLGLSAMTAQAETALKIKTFNPGAKRLFPVASTLVTGPTEAILIDAQFQRDDAQSVCR